MNFYIVVEGRVVEKAVYKVWVPEIRRELNYVDHPSMMITDNFSIVSGNGYPNYFQTIEDAIQDVASFSTHTRLVISVDSEDMTLVDKWQEIDNFVQSIGVTVDYRIVVQHFCFEAWALGNRRIAARHPKNLKLQSLRKFYDVLKDDPEGLPGIPLDGLNRSQLAAVYLQLMLNDKYKGLSYSKSNPRVVAHAKYFHALRTRWEDTGHIQSFDELTSAFS